MQKTSSWGTCVLLCVATFGACGDDAPPDARVDAGADLSLDLEAATDSELPDADVDLPAPQCTKPEAVIPSCGTSVTRSSLLDSTQALEDKAQVYDRLYHALVALHTGTNTEVDVAGSVDRATIDRFAESDSWDLAAFAEKPVEDLASWRKVAGAYAGAGATADAFRYAVLRDQGAACEEVDRARTHLRAAMAAVRRAVSITGVTGVIARGYQRNDLPTASHQTVPLFDDEGNPLPLEKNNGTWREDNSGDSPNYEWEDSCSRDMLIGWVWGMASISEVIDQDPSFTDEERQGLAKDAGDIARSLMQVGEEGYDLEIHDADGRLTFHGYLHESSVDRAYVGQLRLNAQNATMALGIMAALAEVSGDPQVQSYVYNELIRRRRLDEMVRDDAGIADFGVKTNYSNYNMSFTGAWLASRYLCDEEARNNVRQGIADDLYGTVDGFRKPAEQGQSFFDVVYLAAKSGAHLGSHGDVEQLDAAKERAQDSLQEYPAAPYWNEGIQNCDETEIAALECIAADGSSITLLEERGRGGHVVSDTPVPFTIRPPSNYHWRSDPYRVNGEGLGSTLYSGVDFRVAYWMGKYLTVQ